MERLTNGIISIDVKKHGAELASLQHNGREYLWQADKAFWQRHSPVLFPFVGSVWKGAYRTKGQEYKMGQHGFARDMDFELVSKTDTEIRYRLSSNDATKERYPYDFVLEIVYQLIGNTVRVIWHVENPSEEILPFQIGAHPAFYWPMLSNDIIEKGVDAMEAPLAATDCRGYFKIESRTNTLKRLLITEGGCFGEEKCQQLADDGFMSLDLECFSRDAMVFDGGDITKVTLCDDNRKPYLTLSFNTPLVGLWSPPGKRAPFVCIEPWYGRADNAGYEGDLAHKPNVQLLEPHAHFDAHYDITVAHSLCSPHSSVSQS